MGIHLEKKVDYYRKGSPTFFKHISKQKRNKVVKLSGITKYWVPMLGLKFICLAVSKEFNFSKYVSEKEEQRKNLKELKKCSGQLIRAYVSSLMLKMRNMRKMTKVKIINFFVKNL